ncbi:MAG: hypothetical protein A2637_01630 [Candidatus Muproteobacteria bacterium RIFCSPHIGHO2_01_FULL_65_16]|uniref:Uncharacterized protein n=1 Tax=Candidatus Muproteobacteria bacterium RIFCSPHIGHO2_01_FULL_65_16 TaxID=1817764 RepID=A0A1F6TRB8_9PROT|nr:MAG: hypothetical protein A2637_01630 [Candidatus Muproteobacteria bacterium RIFCSPHIGHO2_01_FULL_65_16]
MVPKNEKRKSETKTSTRGANLGFEAKLWAAADALRNSMDAAEYLPAPRLQEPIKDPARFPWYEVTKVQHY